MIISKDGTVFVDGHNNGVGIRDDLASFTREMFGALDALRAGIGNHATNEALFCSLVLVPLRMKIEGMLASSTSYAIDGEPDEWKAKEIYLRILNGEDLDFGNGLL
jgi:hypothetical protein